MNGIKSILKGPDFTGNIVVRGPVFFNKDKCDPLERIVTLSPDQVISEIESAHLKERGGKISSVSLKLQECRKETGDIKYIICNADEGDPGFYKDHILLNESAETVFMGMICAGYACGAGSGIFHLREEYDPLHNKLNKILEQFREMDYLGNNVAGIEGFNFDISIRRSVGAYISGAESALTGAYEGSRDDNEKFIIQKGFLGKPAVVHNVETLASISRIISNGASWFASYGTEDSGGTRIFQVFGDCAKPGIYELEWGASINDIIQKAEGIDISAVLAGGPSGIMLSWDSFSRSFSFSDLSVGGSLVLFGKGSTVLDAVSDCIDFFKENSCGWCVPCRCGTLLLRNKLNKILKGRGNKQDFEELQSWSLIVQKSSRCGFGQTAPNTILSSVSEFGEEYSGLLLEDDYTTEFDIESALSQARTLRYENKKVK